MGQGEQLVRPSPPALSRPLPGHPPIPISGFSTALPRELRAWDSSAASLNLAVKWGKWLAGGWEDQNG